MLVILTLLRELFFRKPASGAALHAQTRHALADTTRCNAEALHVMGMGKRLEDRYATANTQFFASQKRASDIAAAVIAPGQLVVDSNIKKVQHRTGGVVGEVRVRDGDRVRAGDIVVRLDETVTRASLAMVTKCLDQLDARQARLEAEREGAKQSRSQTLWRHVP